MFVGAISATMFSIALIERLTGITQVPLAEVTKRAELAAISR